MSKIGTALYMTLGILIAFLIFTSMVKTAIFTASWFKPDNTVFPVSFYSALVDFIVLVVLFSLIHNVRLYAGAFNDDITFVAGIVGAFIGWLVILSVRIPIAYMPNDAIDQSKILDKTNWETLAIVAVTLAMIVASREILLRGFIFQYLSRGIGETIPTFAIPLLLAIFCGRFEHYSVIEFINLFLFNVVLCYCFRFFHDLWLSSALSFSLYLTAFFSHLPIRELSFIERPNMLTGLEKNWFGSEVTIFAGIQMTIALAFLLFVMHGLMKHKRSLPLRDETLDYPEQRARRPRTREGFDKH